MSTELSSPLKRALFAIKDLQSRIDRLEQGRNEPIAIIGMACRFPGDSSDSDTFWQMLREGRDAIEEVPPERWDINEYYDPDPAMPGKMSSRFGGFLKHIEDFDAYFFKIAPREVLHIDPQQRLLLEVCCEALERAGQVIDASDSTRTGTFVSVAPSDYAQLQIKTGVPSLLDLYFTTGSVPSLAAGRLSYTLGWQGPSMVVDTACSSSLVAAHLACQSLRLGECDMAIAGGVNLVLSPAGNIALSKAHMIAADGRCKTFDAAADGYIRSEGCGVVVLKRLADAQAHHDPILAVIRGSALNQDGRSASLTAPNGAAQEAVIKAALAQAGLKPEQIHYVEAHGTGTSLGDPIEIHALKRVLSKNRAADNPLLVGSVKANIGHTEAAAGIASLIKAVLVVQHREVPPQLHFTTINPNILLDDAAITIPTKVVPLAQSQEQVYVGVSSFGISGTNAHMIVEGPPAQPPATTTTQMPVGETCLLPLSARTNEALHALVRAYQKLLANDQAPLLFDICSTASTRRAHYEHRLTVEAKTLAELSDHLNTFLAGRLSPALRIGQHIHGSQRKITFVFPGQGSQWVGMAQKLLQRQPVFRAMIERCDQVLRQFVPWSLIEILQLPAAALEKSIWIEQVDIIQPATFAIAIALAALWRSWGIEPDSVVGHSMGEVAAAHVAGILSLEDAAQIICYRSQLLRRMRGQGAMAMVELSPEKAQEELRGYEESIFIAAHNGPSSTVLTGHPEALEALLSTLQQRDIFCRKINVDVASHCQQMDPICDELYSLLQGIRPQRTQLSMISTVSGQLCDGTEMHETYWVQNLRQPVLFSEAIQQLVSQDNATIFLEVSPHPILLPAIKDCIQAVGKQAYVLPSLHRNEDEHTTLLRSLATCYVQGCAVNWQNVYDSQGHFTALPTYPWQYERYWITDHYPSAPPVSMRTGENFLLGTHLEDSLHAGLHFWEQEMTGDDLSAIVDSQVEGMRVFPAALYIEEVLQALSLSSQTLPIYILEQVEFLTMLLFSGREARKIQLVLESNTAEHLSFHISSRAKKGETDEHERWLQHAQGTICLPQQHDVLCSQISLSEIQQRCLDNISGDAYYAALATQGLNYPEHHRYIKHIWRRDNEAIVQLELQPEASTQPTYIMHPALIAIGIQVIRMAVPAEAALFTSGQTYVPVKLGRVIVHRQLEGINRVYGRLSESQAAATEWQQLDGDLFYGNEKGDVLLEVQNITLQRLDRKASVDPQELWQNTFYYVQWLEQKTAGTVPALHPDGPGFWLIFADQDDIGAHLHHHLAIHGEQTIQVWPGPRFGMLESGRYQLNPAQPTEFQLLFNSVLTTARSSCRGIIYLWSMKIDWREHETLTTFEETILPARNGLFSLVQALVQQQWQQIPRLWVVTQEAQVLTPGTYPSLAQLPLMEVQKTIALEHPAVHCTSIDLGKIEPETENTWAEILFKQCWHRTIDTQAQAETQIALRENTCFVARIQKRSVSNKNENSASQLPFLNLSADGSYPFMGDQENMFHEGGIDENWREVDEEKQQELVEAYLVKLTSRIFGYPATKVDTRQSLNALGLDSLMTLELTKYIQTDLGITIPVMKILQGISIVQLVVLIVEQAQSHTALPQQADAATHTYEQKHLPAHLIAMQPLGSKPPFYCVHGAVGTVFGYVELSNMLGAEQPFYGLQAPGLEGECEPLTTVEEMAISYIEAIRHIQPHGPYYLGGASFGGAVAFEMACMLHQQGEEIALLVLMDSGLPAMAKGSHVLGDIDSEDARILLHAVRAVSYYFERELPITYEEVFQVPMAERIEYLLARTQNLWPAYVGVERTRNVFKIVRACWQSLLTYVPSSIYPQQVTFFRADGTVPEGLVEPDFHELSDDLPANWSPFAALPLDIYDVAGNHATMIKKPHVYLLAKQLRFCLEAAERRITGEKKC